MSNEIMDLLGMISFSGASYIFYFVIIMMFIMFVFFIFSIFIENASWTTKVELCWPIGLPFYIAVKDDSGNLVKKKVINIEVQETVGKSYNKKISDSTSKEYFKIKNSNYDRQNIFESSYFYRRVKRGAFDNLSKGLKLFVDPKKGLIPLSVQSPVMEVSGTDMNTVISAYANTQKDIRQKHNNDFWAKYGLQISLALIVGAIFISGIFQLKIQEYGWQQQVSTMNSVMANANFQLNQTLSTFKDVIAPRLPG